MKINRFQKISLYLALFLLTSVSLASIISSDVPVRDNYPLMQPWNGTIPVSVNTGDVIISGFQTRNSVDGQDPAEFIELFNTQDYAISLENMEVITRLDNDADGIVETEWQLTRDLTDKTIAPHSFFLIA